MWSRLESINLEDSSPHFKRNRALKAAQRNQLLIHSANTDEDAFAPLLEDAANEEADLLQFYPEESLNGYMNIGYCEHVPSQNERENEIRKTDIQQQWQDSSNVGWSMAVERAPSIPPSIIYEVRHAKEYANVTIGFMSPVDD
ncbi:hypothetical protein DPMN_053429 [Dreissena polymorpha]|uniref:Uncharacterized protein n=1 Tax=Dreissena polymorpha TaxID=45954 RepID=A0A9D4CNL5_DREPO|nr:hypothetical protein DPMN_053429 [Dreissena polymorpha]